MSSPKPTPPMPGIFILMLLLYVAISSYLFIRGWQALPAMSSIRIAYTAVFIILTFGYIIGVIFRRSLPLWLTDTFELACSTWFIAFIYLLIAVMAIDILRLANYWLHFFPSWITDNYAKVKLITFLSVIGIVAAMFIKGNYQFNQPKVNTLEVKVNKPAKGDKKEIRIVMASDLHLGSIVGKKQLAKFVKLINAQKPDIILFAGDILNADLRPVQARRMEEELRQLQAPMGVYGVLGNHEYIGGEADAILEYLQSSGMQILRDEVLNVEDLLTIVGRDDRTNHSRKSLHLLTDSLDKQRAIVLLDHQPYHLEEAEECEVDMMLCGHTHSGQVWPISYIVNRLYEVPQGYKQKGNTHVYVSAGLGIWGPLVRIGTESDILVATLIFD